MIVMGLVLSGVVAFALGPELGALPALRRASPRVRAMLQLAGLAGWAVLPAALLSCAGGTVAALTTSGRLGAGGCWAGLAAGQWQLLGAAAGTVALAPLVVQTWRTVPAARRTELSALARRGGEAHRTASGATVWVVPSPVPLAYAAGLARPTAVVTSTVLAPLGADERRAVLEHEAAHVRLGHPRLLLLGAVIARSYRALPPVRRGWSALRRELEAAADDEAARLVGARVVLSALAQVALGQAGAHASFGDPEHLRYRITRLIDPSPGSWEASAALAGLAVGILGLFAWTTCVLVTGAPALLGDGICLLLAGLVATRPLWSWRYRVR